MNNEAQEVLIRAALDGVPQVKQLSDGKGGMCAQGVLFNALFGHPRALEHVPTSVSCTMFQRFCATYDISNSAEMQCPECADKTTEYYLIDHLNDAHDYDFIAIARKLATPESV